MLLDGDGGLDDEGVEGVWDQRNDQVVLGNLLLQGLAVVDVEGDGAGVLEVTSDEFLGTVESAAGDSDLHARLVELDQRGSDDEAGAEKEYFSSHDVVSGWIGRMEVKEGLEGALKNEWMDGGVDSLCHDVATQCSNCDEGEGGREIKIDMAIDIRLVTGFNNSSGAGTRHLEAVDFLSLSLLSSLSVSQ